MFKTALPMSLGGLLLVGLSSCQMDAGSSASSARLLPVPPLVTQALGEQLNLAAQVRGWIPGEVATVFLAGQQVGKVSAQGQLEVSTNMVPTTLHAPIAELLSRDGETCTVNTVQVSDAAAQVAKFYLLGLRSAATGQQGAGNQLVMATSPAISPAITRGTWTELSGTPAYQAQGAYGGTGRSLALVYADRDVTLKGQRDCTGQTSSVEWSWQESSAINVQLHRGWNTVLLSTASLTTQKNQVNWLGRTVNTSFSKLDLVVQGASDALNTELPWQRNQDPLF